MNRTPLTTAFFHPLNMAMLALTLVAGLCSAWWLAPIGLLLWLVMVIVIARDPGLNITFTRQNRQPLAQRYQVRFDRLDRARISIFNSLAQAGLPLQRAIEPVQTALDEVVEHCYQLSLRMTALDNHYAVQRLSNDFDSDFANLQRKLEQTTDPVALKEYQLTIESLKTRQDQLKSLAAILDRFEAQLTGTINAVDGVVTGVVSLKGRSPQQAKDRIGPLLDILQVEQQELEQFDQQIQDLPVV